MERLLTQPLTIEPPSPLAIGVLLAGMLIAATLFVSFLLAPLAILASFRVGFAASDRSAASA